MRRFILIAPELHDPIGEISVIRTEMPFLSRFRDHAVLAKVANSEDHGIVEAEYLGMQRNLVSLQQGPLTIAALGFDPPDKSAQYHLSMLTTENGLIHVPKVQIDSGLITLILELSKKLNTKRITICEGEDIEHGLVIENGSPEGHSIPPQLVNDRKLSEVLPQGDDELDLRRFIDDSINLLSEQDFNLRRVDDGLPPINLLWPWGCGWRKHVTNLGLQFGEVGYVASNSIRLQGLTRLAGWRHCHRSEFGSGTRLNFEFLLQWIRSHALTICQISEFSQFRSTGKFEELAWLASEMNRRLFSPLSDDLTNGEFQITIISSSCNADSTGIEMRARSGKLAEGISPFDERLLDEKQIPTFSIAEAVRRGIVESE